MKDELLAGLEKWFADAENSKKDWSKNVAINIPSLAGIVTISGTNSTSVASIKIPAPLSGTASPPQLP
jgi:hypothetical protein